jgi:hypothetical protein
MADLPHSSQPASMDSLTVTREEFRLEMHKLLEFLAQGLGGVPGTFTNENVDPLALLLAGAPKLLPTAIPPAKDKSQRLPSTSWVSTMVESAALGVRPSGDASKLVFHSPDGKWEYKFQWGGGPSNASGVLTVVWPEPVDTILFVSSNNAITAGVVTTGSHIVVNPMDPSSTGATFVARVVAGTGVTSPTPGPINIAWFILSRAALP